MSNNKFNQYGSEGDANVIDGSLDIYGYTLRAENLNGGEPLKTNSIGQLISSKLNIADVNNLQAELDSSIQNPNQNNLVSDGVEVTTGNVLKTNAIEPTTAFQAVSMPNMELSGGTITNVQTLTTSRINSRTLGIPILFLEKIDLGNKSIQQVATITATTINATNTGQTLMTGNLDLGENNIQRVIQADINVIQPYSGTNVNFGGDINMANVTNNNITNVGTTTTTNIKTDVIASVLGGVNDDILVNNDFAMNNAGISNVKRVAMAGDILMNNNDILNGGTINIDNVNSSNVDTTTLDAGNINITNNTITSSSVLEFKSGSSDKEYTVRHNAKGNLSCDCMGYIGHGRCKHIKEVSSQIVA